ncbi:hypothetical protein IFM89_035307, partial [Coptis chinensis]
RGALIIHRLCVLLDAERVYLELSTILEGEADLDFASIMVQLFTKVKIVDSNPKVYQHASSVIQSLVEEDINVKFLVQLDKLIRLLETPIFSYLRLQGRVSTQDVFSFSNSDLVLGKYEGGLKLWEGSLDLVKQLRLQIREGQLSLRGKRVL